MGKKVLKSDIFSDRIRFFHEADQGSSSWCGSTSLVLPVLRTQTIFQNSGSGSCLNLTEYWKHFIIFFVTFIPFKVDTRFFTRRPYCIRTEHCHIKLFLTKKNSSPRIFKYYFLMILVDVSSLRVRIRVAEKSRIRIRNTGSIIIPPSFVKGCLNLYL